jgi:hypothetical protein
MSDEDDDDARRLYHRHGHDTEREAAERILPRLNKLQAQVLDYAKRRGRDGFTHIELARDMGAASVSTHRTRVAELVTMGRIIKTTEARKHPPSPNWHTVWRYNDTFIAPADQPASPQQRLL